MNKKIRKDSNGKPTERINQFIIECMFSKYFEEEDKRTIRGQEVAPMERVIAVR